MRMMKLSKCFFALLLVSIVGIALPTVAQQATVLHPADASRILPGSVFFRGQSATVQLRNSGGVHFADGSYVLFALVDNSGYSSGIQEKYQAYLLTEVPVKFGGHTLPPGAYGAGIVKGASGLQFVVQDIAAHDLLTAPATSDARLRRPVPLQVIYEAGKYRLYLGRNYVEFERAH
jgi:hypothetical protein